MSQKEKIIAKLGDGLWHCSRELIDLYCVDYRSVINKLRKEGFVIETKACEFHIHEGRMNMWRLISLPPRFEPVPDKGGQQVMQGVLI